MTHAVPPVPPSNSETSVIRVDSTGIDASRSDPFSITSRPVSLAIPSRFSLPETVLHFGTPTRRNRPHDAHPNSGVASEEVAPPLIGLKPQDRRPDR